MKTITHFLEKRYFFCLLVIFSFALFLRMYNIAEVPDTIHIDEAALGYNAWCLAHYGVDRYLNEMPIYPQNFNGGQSPLYTYIVVLLIKIISGGKLSLGLVRLPGIISSMFVVVFGTKCITYIFHNKKITLMSALLLTVCPYFIMHGRFALDCNLMLGCSTVALYLLIRYIYSKSLRDLIFCGIAFGIVLYSYALSYFVIPLFLILISLYLLYTNKVTIQRIIVLALCVCITALPIIIFIFIMLLNLSPINFFGFNIMPMATQRMTEVATTNFWDNITNIIKITLTFGSYPQDAVDKFYTMYFISIPFVIIGFIVCCYHSIKSIVKKEFHFSVLFVFFFIVSLVTIGLVGAITVYRANYYFIAYIYFLVCGIVATYTFVRSYRNYFIVALSFCYFLWTLSFVRYYFNIYSLATITPYPNSLYFVPADEIIEYVQKELDVENIYIDCITIEEYMEFYNPISPYDVETSRHEEGYGNYYLKLDYSTPLIAGNAYIARKENMDFIAKINTTENEYQVFEYPSYFLYYFE